MSHTYPFNCGRLPYVSLGEVAHRAASIIVSSTLPRAVCLSPRGQVSVERVHEAVDAHVIGVWGPGREYEDIAKEVQDDLEYVRGSVPA